MTDFFWNYMHPKVVELAKPRFEQGEDFYAESITICLREYNSILKDAVLEKIDKELDGSHLVNRAFNSGNGLYPIADLTTESGRNIQNGYMKIFEGAMIGIRNPKSHVNMKPDKSMTIHLLFIVSFMFMQLDRVGLLEPIHEVEEVNSSAIEKLRYKKKLEDTKKEIKSFLGSEKGYIQAINELDWIGEEIKRQIKKLEETGYHFKSFHDTTRDYGYQSMENPFGFVINWINNGTNDLGYSSLGIEYHRGNKPFNGAHSEPENNYRVTSFYKLKYDMRIDGTTGWQVQEHEGNFYTKKDFVKWVIDTLVEHV